jgi:hypothetical protein
MLSKTYLISQHNFKHLCCLLSSASHQKERQTFYLKAVSDKSRSWIVHIKVGVEAKEFSELQRRKSWRLGMKILQFFDIECFFETLSILY